MTMIAVNHTQESIHREPQDSRFADLLNVFSISGFTSKNYSMVCIWSAISQIKKHSLNGSISYYFYLFIIDCYHTLQGITFARGLELLKTVTADNPTHVLWESSRWRFTLPGSQPKITVWIEDYKVVWNLKETNKSAVQLDQHLNYG